MKRESSNHNSINNISNKGNNHKMDFDLYPSISSGKQDTVREVVMKYIDSFFPDASGTSAVAIDNKIEQAMDLVKSHLMIAVREEVEVLKEKISELMDKINQLEVENTILKANLSTETLQQLQLQLAGSAGAGNNMLTAGPQQQNATATGPATTNNTTATNTVTTQQQQQQQQTTVSGGADAINATAVVATAIEQTAAVETTSTSSSATPTANGGIVVATAAATQQQQAANNGTTSDNTINGPMS